MSLLNAHLDQISVCAASIAELPFPPPKIFTNALLLPHDITALIRDTESHERALFSFPGSTPLRTQELSGNTSRRTTTFAFNGSSSQLGIPGATAARGPRRNTAVAAVLGGDLVERIRKGGGGGVGTGVGYGVIEGREKGEVDVDVLLEGAEKLCQVYPIPGAAERITSLRHRHRQLKASIATYEERVAQQAAQLNRLTRNHTFQDYGDDEPVAQNHKEDAEADHDMFYMTEEELKREEEEIKELERKKRGLEDRVTGMERDLAGVLR